MTALIARPPGLPYPARGVSGRLRRLQRSAAAALAALLAILPLTGAADTPAQVEVERDGDRFTVYARAEVAADARTAWETLTDYESLPEFVPGVTRARVLARTPAATGEQLTVEYLGSLRLLFLRVPTAVWLDVRHAPFTEVLAEAAPPRPDRTPTLKSFRGRYRLAVIGLRDGVTRVRIEYDAQFELAEPLPPVLGALFGARTVRQAMREQFEAMVVEIERRARQRPRIEKGSG